MKQKTAVQLLKIYLIMYPMQQFEEKVCPASRPFKLVLWILGSHLTRYRRLRTYTNADQLLVSIGQILSLKTSDWVIESILQGAASTYLVAM